LLLLWASSASAQEIVRFPSLDDNGPGQPATMLEAHLFRPAGEGRRPSPAVVGLHGCSGMFRRYSTQLTPLYSAWAGDLTRHGYVLLLVDSLGPRQHGEMCSTEGFDLELYRKRPKDAYAALGYLQAQPFVRGDRVGVVGWSQGGGVTLFAIGPQHLGRPAVLPQGDFRAAVAFYPGACNERLQSTQWSASIPLLALIGAGDVWTPPGPCQALLAGAAARGSQVETIVYPGAYHGFDAPNNQIRELPEYRTRAGVVPIIGTDPAARADAIARVPAFLGRYLQ
jgi:dienelactone hydrolase